MSLVIVDGVELEPNIVDTNNESVLSLGDTAPGNGDSTLASLLLVYRFMLSAFIWSIALFIVSSSLKYVFIWELAELSNFEIFPTWFFIWEYPPHCLLSPFSATSSVPYNEHLVVFSYYWIEGMKENAAMDVARIPTENMTAKKATHLI